MSFFEKLFSTKNTLTTTFQVKKNDSNRMTLHIFSRHFTTFWNKPLTPETTRPWGWSAAQKIEVHHGGPPGYVAMKSTTSTSFSGKKTWKNKVNKQSKQLPWLSRNIPLAMDVPASFWEFWIWSNKRIKLEFLRKRLWVEERGMKR